MKKSILIILLAVFFTSGLFAQSVEEDKLFDYKESIPAYTEPDLRHFVNAFFEVTMTHIALNFYNRVIDEQIYGQITTGTMLENLKTTWVWDQDEFHINQMYHPYQGSMYFVEGRANGLNFWQSLLPTMYGVLTWEYLMETEIQSINDLIITNISGAYVGEILHRSYQIMEDKCLPLAVVISPFDALTRFVTGQRSPRVSYETSEFSFKSGYSFILGDQHKDSNPDFNTANYPMDYFPGIKAYNQTSNFNVGFDYSYGNRYGHTTKEPLDAFNVSVNFIGNSGYYYLSILSEGLLYSKALNTDYSTTLGLSYNYDFIWGPDLNYNNNSIGLSLSQKIDFNTTNKNHLDWNCSLGFAIDGCSEYYDLIQIYKRTSDSGTEQRLYDIGFGANFKYNIKYVDLKFGTLYSNGFASCFYNPSFAIPTEGSSGCNIILQSEFGYEYPIYKNINLGLSELLYYKHGLYNNSGNVTHKMGITNLYLRYTF